MRLNTMADHHVLLDTFADARRTWDELVGLQPDVRAGGGNLRHADLLELERRVDAHRAAIDALADAIDTEPLDAGRWAGIDNGKTGISNRRTAEQEARERRRTPPIRERAPEPEDAAGRRGEEPLAGASDRQTSRKTGSRSSAQKASGSRHTESPIRAAGKVAGAFDRESGARRAMAVSRKGR
jgi:hypothetical protein